MNWMGATKDCLDAEKSVALISEGWEGDRFIVNEGL
jgi:hypothetical protein